MACQTPFDVLRTKVEDLGPELYLRASWKDPWMNLIPRGSYPKGAGFVRSSFQIGRSEPITEEEVWNAIQPLTTEPNAGPCGVDYNQTYVGFHEDAYKPENFGLVGPLICQDDLTMQWQSTEFWAKYFMALDKRNRKSIINRLGNIYMQYVPKASANQGFAFIAGDISTQHPPSSPVLTGLQGANIPTSDLTQQMLDETASILMEEGADEPNTNGWITQGPSGPVFPILLGTDMSNRILLNNSELRNDYNHAFEGWGEACLTIQRLGASRTIKNFRHVITRFPARWTTQQVNATTGLVSGNDDGVLKRVPVWSMSTSSTYATKGRVAIVNPSWRDPALAVYEGAIVMNPWVYTEEILMPVNSLPGANLKPQNYFGEWTFITGNDALIGFDDCTGVKDPTHKYGRHFAEFRHAAKPIFPEYGRLILFKRCADSFDTVQCT